MPAPSFMPLPALGRTLGVIALAALLGAAGPKPADSPIDVPEPDGLYAGPQHGYTPPTLTGAKVIDPSELEALVAGRDAKGKDAGEKDAPVLIDVSLADHKPAGLPAGTPWYPMHRSIPGAVWLPDAGAVPLAPAREAAFLQRVSDLTGGDKSRAIVTFCHPDCWGSWNAGKRLVMAGYTAVHWMPDGIEGWQTEHDTDVVKSDPAWGRVAADESAPAAKTQH